MQYLLKFKTWIDYFIELNWSRIILNWIFYWIELVKNNFELNILLNWILTVFFWIENWIESFSSEIQSLIESSNCTSQGYSKVMWAQVEESKQMAKMRRWRWRSAFCLGLAICKEPGNWVLRSLVTTIRGWDLVTMGDEMTLDNPSLHNTGVTAVQTH